MNDRFLLQTANLFFMLRYLLLFLLLPDVLPAQSYWQDTVVTGLISPVAFDFSPDAAFS
jgi:hypothetical protein